MYTFKSHPFNFKLSDFWPQCYISEVSKIFLFCLILLWILSFIWLYSLILGRWHLVFELFSTLIILANRLRKLCRLNQNWKFAELWYCCNKYVYSTSKNNMSEEVILTNEIFLIKQRYHKASNISLLWRKRY